DDHKAVLDNAELKKGLRLVWFGCGKEDFLVKTSEATVGMLKKHGFDVVSRESAGGHTWINWRDYLNEFAPLLFAEKSARFNQTQISQIFAEETTGVCAGFSPDHCICENLRNLRLVAGDGTRHFQRNTFRPCILSFFVTRPTEPGHQQ